MRGHGPAQRSPPIMIWFARKSGSVLACVRGIHLVRRFALVLFLIVIPPALGRSVPSRAETRFNREVQPILSEFCYECHGEGMHKGQVMLDQSDSNAALLANRDLWWRVLKNSRAGLMPPDKKPRPSAEQMARLQKWI